MGSLDYFNRNHLLASLMEAGCESFRSGLDLISMEFGDVLYEVESKLVDVYFPTNSVVSLLSVTENGTSDETAFVGSEGIVGVPLFLGAETSPHRVVVRRTGHAFRLNGQLLLDEFNRSSEMKHLLLRYTQSLITQISQALVCNRHHSIYQQFCRWLLTSIDRSGSNELCHTQEAIALMLGVRRETITKVAGELQSAGLIQNRRGRIVVIDRHGLEARACECYRGMKTGFDRHAGTASDTNTASARYRQNRPVAARYLPVVQRAANRAYLAAAAAA